MTIQFRLPELGENVESGDLVKILVSVGDKVARDQPVVELETDKADFEVPTPVAGLVREIHVREGETIKVGQVVLTIEEDSSDGRGIEMGIPAAHEDRLKVAKEEEARTGVAPQTSAGEEKPAEEQGRAASQLLAGARGDTKPERGWASGPFPLEREGHETERQLLPAAPSVLKLARELGVPIEEVHGSGPAGRLSAEDVKAYARRILQGPRRAEAAALPDFSRWGEIERKGMSNVRRKTMESMIHSWTSVPHVTQYDKADISVLEQLRERFAHKVVSAGGRLTVTAVAVKIVASALKIFPNFAASLDPATNEIILKKYCHIGVAVDTDRGLIVPVIHDADRKSIIELSVELVTLAEKARDKKLSLEEMEGGVFTITNLGGIGGTQFSPIVYAPQVAILGVSRARIEPLFSDGQFESHLMLPLSLSYDHRLIDGADAARFLRWVAEAFEQPFLLVLQT